MKTNQTDRKTWLITRSSTGSGRALAELKRWEDTSRSVERTPAA